ncbi:MAG: phosphomannomutase/phosphoglucomutase [Nanoarchaeota archaeon]|nr:phosphomannomutase/phosphoglucomutase [Nanoarchaeota archaeon]
MTIFKAYDIRGVYGNELTEETAYSIGRAYVSFLAAKTVVVGRDMRESGEALFAGLTRGMIEAGARVIDIGVVATPMVYFACGSLKADGGIMITASHNPAQYNGFKMTRDDAIPISGDTGIREIERRVNEGDFIEAGKKGSIEKKDISAAYKKHVLGFVGALKGKKIVVDAANGMGGLETRNILSCLSCEIIEMYTDLDGRFPNHEADPLREENTAKLQKRVLKEKADVGIAFDGDADRVFFVDESGKRVPADFITCLIAQDILSDHPGETFLYDLRSSRIVAEIIEKDGGKCHMSRVGHAFIKEQLRKENAVFAGELSGHFYFRDNYYTDSGIIAALKVIELLCRKDETLSSLVSHLHVYFHSGEINSKVDDSVGIMKTLASTYASGDVSELDGIRVDFDEWWFNVRASNTEPLLRLNVEATSKKLLQEKKKELLKIILG